MSRRHLGYVPCLLLPVALLLPFSAHASSQPASSQPASSQPASSQPASSQPASSQPASSQSAAPDARNPGPGTIAAIPLDEAVMSGGLVVTQAHAETLRPAPLPDPDISAPGPSSETLASQASPSIAPDFFNPNAHAIGDGYAPGSAIETDHNNRHSTGGGMSLSIPMQ